MIRIAPNNVRLFKVLPIFLNVFCPLYVDHFQLCRVASSSAGRGRMRRQYASAAVAFASFFFCHTNTLQRMCGAVAQTSSYNKLESTLCFIHLFFRAIPSVCVPSQNTRTLTLPPRSSLKLLQVKRVFFLRSATRNTGPTIHKLLVGNSNC